jgi:hypothetical protein
MGPGRLGRRAGRAARDSWSIRWTVAIIDGVAGRGVASGRGRAGLNGGPSMPFAAAAARREFFGFAVLRSMG